MVTFHLILNILGVNFFGPEVEDKDTGTGATDMLLSSSTDSASLQFSLSSSMVVVTMASPLHGRLSSLIRFAFMWVEVVITASTSHMGRQYDTDSMMWHREPLIKVLTITRKG